MRILFLGAPGAGKGTQCKRLAKQCQLPHLASGDLLREAVQQGTVAGIRAKQFMDEGKLVPDEVLINMFRDKLTSPACGKGFILDGFPRNLAQAQALNVLLAELNQKLDVVINLEVDEKLLLERLTGRRICSNKACNQPFHLSFRKPKQENVCDVCGSALMHRSDDKAELVGPRLKTYHDETEPLLTFYADGGKSGANGPLKNIDGSSSEEEIFAQLLQAVPCSSNK